MSWLVTGAAGYIGAHVVAALRAEGEMVVALDDLSAGRPERLPRDVQLVRASVADRDEIASLLGDQENLVPRVLTALAGNRPVQVFGDDYPTRDGSCIRDYVGVEDIARAHLLAARALRAGQDLGVLNLGRGEGATVLEVLDEIGAASGRPVDYEIAGRRPGDPAEVVARVDRAERVLGWRADQDLADMVGSACRAFATRRPGALPGVSAPAPRGSG
jgi:UDP-glucose 4-epimerase